MQLIIKPKELRAKFILLLDQYQEYFFATAWAGMPDGIIENLKNHSDRIRQMIVGIHFYQTHPDFLKTFVDNKHVHILLQPIGTFHPKLFLFYNSSKDWTLLIGSANFTEGGFFSNTEAVFVFNSGNYADDSILENAKKLVSDCWNSGLQLNAKIIKKYQDSWDVQKKRRKSLELPFGYKTLDKIEGDIMLLDWKEYVKKYWGKSEVLHNRFDMLDLSRSLFKEKKSLIHMTADERRFIGGTADRLNCKGSNRFRDFGTNGNGTFKNYIKLGNIHFSNALDEIPFDGEVTENHFNNFVKHFLKAEEVEETWVSSAGRLLIMKRPDTFYSITSANEKGFRDDFDIVPSRVNLHTYWELIAERINNCIWWQAPKPEDNFEVKLWHSRAAMLDVLYYTENKM